MPKRILLLLVLVVGACTNQAATTTSAQPDQGLLAVIDGHGDVVVMDGEGSERKVVADSGEADRLLAQPIWSPDGSLLSWAEVSPDGFAYVVGDLAGGPSTKITMANFPYYAYWAPSGDRLGLLRDGEGEVVLELAIVEEGRSTVVDADAPYYFSWSPEGDRLVAHAGAARLVTRGADGTQESLGQTTLAYLAPQWISPGVLHVVGDELVIEMETERTSVAQVGGLTLFVANRQGTHVAMQTISETPAVSVALTQAQSVTPNTVVVVDIDSGAITQVYDRLAVGFFWSQDGDSLLVLAPAEEPEALTAHVWDGVGIVEYSTYVPSPIQVRDLFPFFPQYAQSLSFWSPDSSAFALVGTIGDQSGVWVQTLGEPQPTLVSDGTWAAWSP